MRCLLAAAAAFCLVAGSADAMPVREFLARMKAFDQMGEKARDDPALKKLVEEIGTIVKAYRAESDKAAASGKPRSCLPPAGKAQITSGPMKAYFETLSPAEQEMELKDALYAFLDKTYPCPAA
jgi:hypothetical protein